MVQPLRVVVAGATGKTGSAVARYLLRADGVRVVGAVARRAAGRDLGEALGIGPVGVPVAPDVESALAGGPADALVDFTAPDVAGRHLLAALGSGLHAVVGTTGLAPAVLREADAVARERGLAAVVLPNFSLGAWLLLRLAREAARVLGRAEVVELHHATKVDAPSGTALRLAEVLARAAGLERVPVHSVRLPGLVAHHEVIFGGEGETLTLRHDTVSRDAFAPGVLLALRRLHRFQGLVTDLDALFAADEAGTAAATATPSGDAPSP